jgi:hypothetical protein
MHYTLDKEDISFLHDPLLISQLCLSLLTKQLSLEEWSSRRVLQLFLPALHSTVHKQTSSKQTKKNNKQTNKQTNALLPQKQTEYRTGARFPIPQNLLFNLTSVFFVKF